MAEKAAYHGFSLEEVEGFELEHGLDMFRRSDQLNTRNAFLAGYFEATGGVMAKPGSQLEAAAIKRGDTVAAKTQFLYTAGNRSALAADLVGASRPLAKMAGIFTSWSSNYMDLMLDWTFATGKPSLSPQLRRYLGANAVLAATLGAAGVEFWKYSGIDAIPGFLSIATGNLPAAGLAGGLKIGDPKTWFPQFIRDLMKEDQDLAHYLWYMYTKPQENLTE